MTTPQQRRAAEEALAGGRREDPQPRSPADFPEDGWTPSTGELVGYVLGSGPARGELRPALVLRPARPEDFPTAKTLDGLAELLRRRGLPVRLGVGKPWLGVVRVKVFADPELDGLPEHATWAAWSPVPLELHWAPLPSPGFLSGRCGVILSSGDEAARCLLAHGHNEAGTRCWPAGSTSRVERWRGPDGPGDVSPAAPRRRTA